MLANEIDPYDLFDLLTFDGRKPNGFYVYILNLHLLFELIFDLLWKQPEKKLRRKNSF